MRLSPCKANGQAKAFAAFNDPKGQFVNKGLYNFVLDMNAKILAHGANAGLIGKNMMGTKDADGKLFMKEMVETAKKKRKGTVDYKWENPKTLLLISLSFLYRRHKKAFVKTQ